MATTNLAPAIPRRARSTSATSDSGSAPRRMRQSTLPFADASRIVAASLPLRGASPSDNAPRTFPRRKTGNTLAAGATERTALRASIVCDADSARFARPATTTTGPDASCAAISACTRSAGMAPAAVPDSARIDFHAYFVRPVS